MKKTFTKQYMQENCGCYSQNKLMESSFMSMGEISIESIINSEIPLKDKYWFVIRKTELTIAQKRQIAVDVAEIVLPIYEAKYPENKAPREAIEAAKLYLGGHISLSELLAKRAADAAAAAYAAAAYAAAAYAAYADDAAVAYADAAAVAYADAAYAAVAYADAAAYVDAAYAAAAYKTKLFKYLVYFVENN